MRGMNYRSMNGGQIGPFLNRTGVVGGNGVGKSNIIGMMEYMFNDRWMFREIRREGMKENESIRVEMEIEGQDGEIVEISKESWDDRRIEYKWGGESIEKEEYYGRIRGLGVMVVN